MDRRTAEVILQKVFGFERFYDEQWMTIEHVLRGKRVLLIERTGFGKSLCYQFPATQLSGVTVVFSPLIALMRDQVKALNDRGIKARYINSEQSPEQNRQTLKDALNGEVKILYIAPERQENREWIEAARRMDLSMVVVDEAHTISTWGHDFRPAFRRIVNLVKLLPRHLPVLATTATATKKVQEDIEKQISGNITTIRGTLLRDNLQLYVIKVKSEDEKMHWMSENIPDMMGTGIIYTGTRANTEVYARWLDFLKLDAVQYNAGLDAESRKEVERGLMTNRWKAVVSTNALGMGIDKPDIRFIIHTQIPASPIHYYQEIGRAGRDGEPTPIILFYNDTISKKGMDEDCQLPRSFIDTAKPSIAQYRMAIEAIRREPLGQKQILMETNLKFTQIRNITADLIEQGIAVEVSDGRSKKYEYRHGAREFDTEIFDIHRRRKLRELESMVAYVNLQTSRMKFLCTYLGDQTHTEYGNCDNTNLRPFRITASESTAKKLIDFRDSFFPALHTAPKTTKTIEGKKCVLSLNDENKIVLEVESEKPKLFDDFQALQKVIRGFGVDRREGLEKLVENHLNKPRLVNGAASGYYGMSNVGAAIHRSKYEGGGDFPDFLLRSTLKAIRKKFGNSTFDLIVYVPPTESGDLVKNFAVKLSKVLRIPLSHGLTKTKETMPQKRFKNSYLKKDNVAGKFQYAPTSEITGKRILLFDDIFDSGATIMEIGKVLSEHAPKCIAPVVIAKTLGDDL